MSPKRSYIAKATLRFFFLFIMLGITVDRSVHAALPSSLSLTMHNHQFSANIIRAPLEQVLHTISSYGSIQFVIKGNVETDQISSSFRHLSLEKTLEKILIKYDFAIIQHQVDPAQKTSEFPYFTEVVILSRNHPETLSESKEPLVISPSSQFTLPGPAFPSVNLEDSDSLASVDVETETPPGEILEELEEVLPNTDTESLAFIKHLLEE